MLVLLLNLLYIVIACCVFLEIDLCTKHVLSVGDLSPRIELCLPLICFGFIMSVGWDRSMYVKKSRRWPWLFGEHIEAI